MVVDRAEFFHVDPRESSQGCILACVEPVRASRGAGNLLKVKVGYLPRVAGTEVFAQVVIERIWRLIHPESLICH